MDADVVRRLIHRRLEDGRLPHGRMAVGAPAGMILTRARTINELLSRPQNDRVVLYAGKQIDRTLPDYRELD